MYKDADKIANQKEKELLAKFNEEGDMTKEELAKQIMKVREDNESYKENILEDKSEALENLKLDLHKELQNMATGYDDNPDIKIVWDSHSEEFHASER